MIHTPRPLPKARRVPWALVAVFAIVVAGILALSRIYFASQARYARDCKEEELAAVAELTAVQLTEWRQDGLNLAAAVLENRPFAERVRRLIADPADGPARRDILEFLERHRRSFHFEWAALLLAGRTPLLSYPLSADVKSSPESTSLGIAARQDQTIRIGYIIGRDGPSSPRSVVFFVPILSTDEGPTAAVALLEISYDVAKSIDPILAKWPIPDETAEALIVERRGSEFVHLNSPRLSAGGGTPSPVPIAGFRRAGSHDTLGVEGIAEGLDYRGVQVLAYLKAVPDSSWIVMAKIDLKSIDSEIVITYRTILAITIACIVLCGFFLILHWRRSLAAQAAYERTKWDEANRNMDEFMRHMINIMPNPAFFKDAQGIYQGTNAAFEKLLGLSKKELVGKTIGDVAPDEIARLHQEHDQALLTDPGHQVYEAPFKAWDGEHHVIFIKSTYQRPDGTIGGIVGILKDMTQRLRAEEELDQLKRFSDSTVQTMTEGLVLTDSEGRFTFVNPAAAQMLGFTPAEMVDREVVSFIPKDQRATVRREDEKRAKGISDRYELVFLHKDGSRRTLLVSGGPRIHGAQFGGTLAVLTDITERKDMEEEIKALSLRDELTTLYNRRGFLTLAEQQLKTASRLKKRVALLYLDMDNLKRINDSGGHKLGDRALAEVAFVLKKSFREADIIGRLGGDEFSVLAMETTGPLDPAVLVKRLRDKLDSFNARSSAEAGFSLAISVGVFTRDPEASATVEEMLSRADLLMYEEKRAKKKGDPEKPPGPSK